jgi:hypothetical protein
MKPSAYYGNEERDADILIWRRDSNIYEARVKEPVIMSVRTHQNPHEIILVPKETVIGLHVMMSVSKEK